MINPVKAIGCIFKKHDFVVHICDVDEADGKMKVHYEVKCKNCGFIRSKGVSVDEQTIY